MQVVQFVIENQQFAIDIALIQGAVRMVALQPIPDAPPHIMGLINVRGNMMPVINIRQLLHLPEKEIELSDQLIICEKEGRPTALWVDEVIGSRELSALSLVSAKEIVPHWKLIDKAWKDGASVIYILQLEKLFSLSVTGAPK